MASVLLQRWQTGARRCRDGSNMLIRNNYYSVKNFLKKTLDYVVTHDYNIGIN